MNENNTPDCSLCRDAGTKCVPCMVMAYPALTARVKELEEALAEAIGWNWLDGDVPQGIQDKCCDPLNKEPTT